MLIETHIRQDAITLYGFYDQAERTWFRMLTAIQGVGPKAALSMLSTLAPMDLAFAISADDKASLCRSPGVGQKLAIRVISELRDKVGALALEYGAAQPASVERDRPTSGLSADERDAVSALANLGWKAPEAHAAISRVKVGSSGPLGLSDLIRAGLKELSPR
jgi:Holliday junction DNA helicase RuvA